MPDSLAHRIDREISSRGEADAPETDASSDFARRTATRADLLDGLSSACPNLSRSETREVFEMALTEMSDALIRGELVKLRSFGMFAVREKRERIGRNPRTGVEVAIKPRRVLTFRPSPVLLDLVNAVELPPALGPARRDGVARKKR